MSSSTNKDSKESRDKKRIRKTAKPESRADSPDSKKSKPAQEQRSLSSQDIFYLEERSAVDRRPADDVTVFKRSCDKLRDIMEKIQALKGKTDESSVSELAALRKMGILEFVVLKRMNRMARFSCKAVRETTHEAKQQIDKHHLRLQNLLYEIMHLQREITKCLDFKSHDEDISLVDVDQFYTEAPAEIAKPDVTRKDMHQQTLARLDWELEQRKRLAKRLMEAKGSKSTLKQEIDAKQQYLESLQPKLNTILQATKPVQEHLDMRFDEIREQHRSATYLPRPLYVLYMQASAYQHACDKNIEVSIQGDLDVAKSLGQSTSLQDEDSESDGEERGERRRHSERGERPGGSGQERVLRTHPLSVQLTITCPDGSTLALSLYYMLVLEIVTVKVALTQTHAPAAEASSASELLSAENLLCCLYADDYGSDTPDPANKYALRRAGIATLGAHAERLGRAYRWAQSICGLQLLGTLEADESHLDTTIARLRARVAARIALHKQLSAFEKCSISVPSDCQHLFPAKITSNLASWKRITYEDFVSCPYTQHVVAAGLICDTHLCFQASIQRGSATLSAHVVVPPDYPQQPPVFALRLLWKAERTACNDEHIRDMEAEVNVHWRELTGARTEDLVTCQLARLLMCLDVYVETECASGEGHEGPQEFAKERIVSKIARGRGRSKPWRYTSHLGIFQQR